MSLKHLEHLRHLAHVAHKAYEQGHREYEDWHQKHAAPAPASRPLTPEEQDANWQSHVSKMRQQREAARQHEHSNPPGSFFGALMFVVLILGLPIGLLLVIACIGLAPALPRVALELGEAALLSGWSDPTGRMIIVAVAAILGWKILSTLGEVFQ